jgi:hypothetical protein
VETTTFLILEERDVYISCKIVSSSDLYRNKSVCTLIFPQTDRAAGCREDGHETAVEISPRYTKSVVATPLVGHEQQDIVL